MPSDAHHGQVCDCRSSQSLGRFRIAPPVLHVDSCFRRNDRYGGCVEANPLCRFGGGLGACNAPLRGYAVMVQRNAAGSLRVSLKVAFFLSPKTGGFQGVDDLAC